MYVFHRILALGTFEFEINVILGKSFFTLFFNFCISYLCIIVRTMHIIINKKKKQFKV